MVPGDGSGRHMDGGPVSIAGTYRVVSVERMTDDGEIREPFGPDPEGFLLYGPDGMMAAVVGASARPLLGLDLLAETVSASDGDLAAAFRAAYGFVGSYEVTGSTVVHHLMASTVPNWVGTEQVRPFTLDGDELVLRPPGWRVVGRRTRAAG